MRILVAEDDAVARRVLTLTIQKWGHEIIVSRDGDEAYAVLNSENPPKFIILDWVMPGRDGLELCKYIRSTPSLADSYVLFLTAKSSLDDMLKGLDAGADDYIAKPFDGRELHARVKAGVRVLQTELALSNRIANLETAVNHIKKLQNLLPVCAWCKKVKTDEGYWEDLQEYIESNYNVELSHGICEDCVGNFVGKNKPTNDSKQPSIDVSLIKLAQDYHTEGATGMLSVINSKGNVGRLYFVNGQLLFAQAEDAEGEQAFYRVICWENIKTTFEENTAEYPTNINRPTMAIINQGISLRD